MTPRAMMAVALLAAVLAARSVQAAPVQYAESVSGDLPALPGAAFTLDVGNNTFSGTTQFLLFHNGIHYDADVDSVAFRVPDGSKLAAISLSFRVAAMNVSKAFSEFDLCLGIGDCAPATAAYVGARTVSYLDASPLAVDFGAAGALGTGTYTLFDHGIGIAPLDSRLSEGWVADYTWTLGVVAVAAPVPEPEAIAMWALGTLAVLLAVRRRASPARASTLR